MILVHRLRGEPMFINCDLIESIESTPDTVVTMVDGRRMVVADSPEVVIERVRDHRAALIAGAAAMRSGERAKLFVVDGAVPDDAVPNDAGDGLESADGDAR